MFSVVSGLRLGVFSGVDLAGVLILIEAAEGETSSLFYYYGGILSNGGFGGFEDCR